MFAHDDVDDERTSEVQTTDVRSHIAMVCHVTTTVPDVRQSANAAWKVPTIWHLRLCQKVLALSTTKLMLHRFNINMYIFGVLCINDRNIAE